MPRKSQPGGSTEESASTKPRKSTTKKPSTRVPKPKIVDEATATAQQCWNVVQNKVLERTIGSAPQIRSANPRSPEDKAWWDTNGPEMVADYIRFRELSGWSIMTMPDGKPAIELEMQVAVGNTSIKMVLDRVLISPTGEAVLVDLKTGRRVPSSTLQLGFYRYGLKKQYNIDVDLGSYWMSRSAAMTDTADLREWTEEKIEYLVTAFDRARKAHSFIPNTSSCGMCGYTKHCIWYTKGEKQ